MGKLLITNSAEYDDTLRAVFKDSGFSETAHTECGDMRLTSYKKLRVDNCNYFSQGDDFAACSGTLIYKEKFGEPALRELLNDAASMSVTELRKNCIGSYVIAVKTGSVIRIFVDETHIYKFYYYCTDKNYLLTSTYYHVEKIAGQPIHKDAFLEKLTRPATMSRQTPYQNIYKINAAEFFKIDLAAGTFGIETCELNDYHCSFKNKEEALETLYERIKKISAIRSRYIHSYEIFLTGGLDSRLEYAIHLFNKDNVSPAYWISSNELFITNGTDSDWEIVSNLAYGGGGQKASRIDVTESLQDSYSQITPQKCGKYGEYSYIYASNSKWFSIFENSQTEAFTFGFFGETLRTLSEIERHYKYPYSLLDMIRDIYCRDNHEKKCFHSDTLYDFIESEYKVFTSGMDTNNLTSGEIFKLFTYSRFEADALMDNFMNMFAYSFPILAQKFIADANFSIPYEWRDGDFFSISLTKLFCPKLLEFPFYSHHHVVIYDSAKNIVRDYVPEQGADEHGIKARIKNFLGTDSMIYKVLSWVYGRTFNFKLKKQKKQYKKMKAFVDLAKDYEKLAEQELRKSKTVLKYGIEIVEEGNRTYPQVTAAFKVADTLL